MQDECQEQSFRDDMHSHGASSGTFPDRGANLEIHCQITDKQFASGEVLRNDCDCAADIQYAMGGCRHSID